MIADSTKVTALAAITGRSAVSNPYSSQRTMPIVKTRNMLSEISSVERVRQVRITCGTKDTVVQNAAARPIKVTADMANSFVGTTRFKVKATHSTGRPLPC